MAGRTGFTGAGRDEAGFGEKRRGLVALLELEGIRDRRVLEAIAAEPRHLYVPPDLEDRAYDNAALPIGEGQTISQPLVVACMMEALEVEAGDKVLEVGTGSGYQAGLLDRLGAEVHTVERHGRLVEAARACLAALGHGRVRCYEGDGSLGLPEEAPFQAICVTAGSPRIPEALREQLAPGGRLVIPVGSRGEQLLRRLRRFPGGGEAVDDLLPVRFVPLVGRGGWEGDL